MSLFVITVDQEEIKHVFNTCMWIPFSPNILESELDAVKGYRIKDKNILSYIIKSTEFNIHRQVTILVEHFCQINQLDTVLIIYDFAAFSAYFFIERFNKNPNLFNVTPNLLKLIFPTY